MAVRVLTEAFADAPWELVRNTTTELEERPQFSSQPIVVGTEGNSTVVQTVPTMDGDTVELALRVQWKERPDVDPDELEITNVEVAGPAEPVYFFDRPTDELDPDYSWQTELQDEIWRKDLAKEVLEELGDLRRYEV